MSRVLLIAADKPLPLCSRQEERSKTVQVGGTVYTIACEAGFAVREHGYYRCAVDDLGLSMKPCQYELALEACEADLSHLKTYLRENLTPGDTAELWNLWVGDDRLGAVPHFRGALSDMESDTLEQFLESRHPDGGIGQCCMTVLI